MESKARFLGHPVHPMLIDYLATPSGTRAKHVGRAPCHTDAQRYSDAVAALL